MNTNRKYDILESAHSDDVYGFTGRKTFNGFNGLTPMNHQRALSIYAQELVAHYAVYSRNYYTLSLEDLPETEQDELARLYIEAHDREVNECIYGEDFTINSDFTCALLSMLKNNCKLTREHFANITRKNILIYYKKSLEKILDEACDEYLLATNDNYYREDQDQDYAELGWSI